LVWIFERVRLHIFVVSRKKNMYHIIYLYVYSTYYNIGSCLFPLALCCSVRLGSLVLYAFTYYDTSCLYIYEINNILWIFGNMCAIWFPTLYFNNARVCVSVCLQRDVTYSEHIVHYTTNNNHTGQSTSHWRLYLSSDKFGLETTENRFVRHKALAERIGRANVRGFGAGNENRVKRRVPLFSKNIYI